MDGVRGHVLQLLWRDSINYIRRFRLLHRARWQLPS